MMDKKQATEIVIAAGTDLDVAVEFLLKAREKNENIFIDFNGHKLFSADVTLDSAYLEVTGMTKKQVDEKFKEYLKECREREEKEIQKLQEKIPYWKKEGRKYIEQDLWETWDKCVEIRANDLYHGMELDNLLEILVAIDEGKAASKNDVEKILDDQNHSGSSYGIMKSMLNTFSNAYKKLPNDIENN